MSEAAGFYDVLGVARDATPEQIRSAYRKRASENHPDRFQNLAERAQAEQRMQAINQANDVLSDPERRAQYDAGGGAGEALTPEQATERQAMQELGRLFTHLLDEGEGNIVAQARKLARGGSDEAKRRCEALRKRVLSLQRKRELVATKNGRENMVHAIIDGQVQTADRQIAQLEQSVKVAAAIEKLLDDYEYTGPTAPPGGFDSRDNLSAYGFRAMEEEIQRKMGRGRRYF